MISILFNSLLAQHKYGTAETLGIEYSALCDELYGLVSQTSLAALSNLAICYHNQKKFNLASKLFVRLLQRQRTADLKPVDGLGLIENNEEFWLNMLSSMKELAKTYFALDSKESSTVLFEEIAKSSATHLGASHERSLSSYSDLIILYQTIKKFDLAEAVAEQLVAISIRGKGEQHADTILWMRNLSTIYMSGSREDKVEKAEGILLRVLNIQRQFLTERDDEIKQTISMLNELKQESE